MVKEVRHSLRWMSRITLITIAAGSLGGCAFQSAPGPYANKLSNPKTDLMQKGIKFIPLDNQSLQRALNTSASHSFAESFGSDVLTANLLGKGDLVSFTIWEAPPATLFSGTSGSGLAMSSSPASGISFPEQIVNSAGNITVPFVGEVRADGRTALQVAQDIKLKLRGKANQPQVVVRLVGNAAANATIVGEVQNSVRVQLTPHGERLLDAIAAAGGVKHPLTKMTLQITRGDDVRTMPLADVVADPKQNVILQPGDVVTALFQPYSFTALGATGKNEEVSFEATGITLSQALGRSGGLIDNRANPKGVFIFRYEYRPEQSDNNIQGDGAAATDDLVPVIYQVNLKDPASFFLAQRFPIRNKDIIYVSNAGIVDLQRFANIVGSFIAPAATAVSIGVAVN